MLIKTDANYVYDRHKNDLFEIASYAKTNNKSDLSEITSHATSNFEKDLSEITSNAAITHTLLAFSNYLSKTTLFAETKILNIPSLI